MAGTTEMLCAVGSSAPESGMKSHLVSAVQEVFSTMVGAELSPAGDEKALGLPNLTAIVGLAGIFNGVVSVRCDMRTARVVAARMLGLEESGDPADSSPEVDASAADAMGEICNMVAGAFKTRLCEGGTGCLLSVPSVIIGADYHLRLLAVSDKADARFMFTGMPIWVSVEVRH
jgi:chemotaxis protein CheX